MTSDELSKARAKITNGYLQYLLYKNNIIKSSSFTPVGLASDLDRRLCFFIKTSWSKDVALKGISEFVGVQSISRGTTSLSIDLPIKNSTIKGIIGMIFCHYVNEKFTLDGDDFLRFFNVSSYRTTLSVSFNFNNLFHSTSSNDDDNSKTLKEKIDLAYEYIIMIKEIFSTSFDLAKDIYDRVLLSEAVPSVQYNEFEYKDVGWTINDVSMLLKSVYSNLALDSLNLAINTTISIIGDRKELLHCPFFTDRNIMYAIYGKSNHVNLSRFDSSHDANPSLGSLSLTAITNAIAQLESFSSSLRGDINETSE